MDLDKETIRILLRRKLRLSMVERVIRMDVEPAIPKGENHMSEMYRIKLIVELDNSRKVKWSFILKRMPAGAGSTSAAHEHDVFRRETLTYSLVFNEMDALMNEYGDSNDPLWCDIIHYVPFTILLLEDLKPKGFKNVRRQDLLDFDHAMLVLRSLGRFHALSKVIEKRGVDTKDSKHAQFLCYEKVVNDLVFYPIKVLSKTMETNWGPEWKDVAKKLSNVPAELFLESSKQLKKADESRFNCTNHGDCWINNIMFKYDWQSRPYTLRFVDLQFVHYNTPAFDFVHFFYSSVRPEVRASNFQKLQDSYLDSLNSTLDFYSYEGPKLTKEEFNSAIDDVFIMKTYALLVSFPLSCSTSIDSFNLDLILKSGGTKGLEPSFYDDNYRKQLGPDLIKLAEQLTQKQMKRKALNSI